MRQVIGKLLGWTVEEDGYHHFCFVDDLHDYGHTGVDGYRLCGACLTEVQGITPDDYQWWLSDEGLVYHFEERDETLGMAREGIIAYGKQEVATWLAEHGEPCLRFFDTPEDAYEAQLRAAGFGPEQYVCFDSPGTWMHGLEFTHVCDADLLARVEHWQSLAGTLPVSEAP